jgi:serine/threonine-protein kinase HipA
MSTRSHKHSTIHEITVLKLSLHNRLVGFLTGFQNGRNVLHFANE